MHRRAFLSTLTASAGLLAAGTLGGALLAGCAPTGPRAVAFGREACAFCRMTVDDPRHAAQLATRTGKVHAFDSLECCARWIAEHGEAEVRTVWVSDVRSPSAAGHRQLAATAARFWRTAAFATPMGGGMVATADAVPPAAGAEGPLDWAAARGRLAQGAMGSPGGGGDAR